MLVPFRNAAFRIINTIINEVGCFPVAKCVSDVIMLCLMRQNWGCSCQKSIGNKFCISKDFKKSLGPKQMSQKQMSTQANLPVRLWRVAACSQHISYSFRGGRFQMGVRWQ